MGVSMMRSSKYFFFKSPFQKKKSRTVPIGPLKYLLKRDLEVEIWILLNF